MLQIVLASGVKTTDLLVAPAELSVKHYTWWIFLYFGPQNPVLWFWFRPVLVPTVPCSIWFVPFQFGVYSGPKVSLLVPLYTPKSSSDGSGRPVPVRNRLVNRDWVRFGTFLLSQNA